MAAIQALQRWCKQQCEGYQDVAITNMTTSFRDGLAFCAILHRHRPDLINFSSLRKENVYENNQLAFEVAETELGIPALLDAEDMVALKVPDRLSVLTYVSQYYNYFHGRSPIGGVAGIKRPPPEPSEEPTGKKAVSKPVPPSPAKPARLFLPLESKVEPAVPGHSLAKEKSPAAQRRVLAERSNVQPGSCALCGSHVHLVQRLLVDGKLYHRNCFRCKECSRTLQSRNYKAGAAPGTFVCSHHVDPTPAPCLPAREASRHHQPSSTPSGNYWKGLELKKTAPSSVKTSWAVRNSDAVQPAAQDPSVSGNNKTFSTSISPRLPRLNPVSNKTDPPAIISPSSASSLSPSPWTAPSSLKIQQAREKFFQSDPAPSGSPVGKREPVQAYSSPFKPSLVPGAQDPAPSGAQPARSSAGASEKDRARNILLQALPGPQPLPRQPGGVGCALPKAPASNASPSPPDISITQHPQPQKLSAGQIPRPVDRPPAMEAAGRRVTGSACLVKNAPSDPSHKDGSGVGPQNQVKDWSTSRPAESSLKPDTKFAKARSANVAEEKTESPADWRSRLKPVPVKIPHSGDAKTSQKPAEAHKVVINIDLKPGQNDKKPPLLVTSPGIHEAAPPAQQPQKKKLLVPQPDVSSSWKSTKPQWESHPGAPNVEALSSSKKVAPVRPSSPKTSQKPPNGQVSPLTKRHPDFVPEEEIQREVQRIERDLDKLERKGITLEKQLRNSCEGDDFEDALMVEWFQLIHEKQLLLRRESELMHKMNQQKLEAKQVDIETELRDLMSKADFLKTPRERAREKELLDSYLDTVNGRNKIVEDLDEDRLRELEEDEMIAAMIQKLGVPRNGQENEKKKTKFGLFKLLKTKS